MLLIAQPVHAVDTDPEIKATNYNLLVHLDTKKNQLQESTTITIQNNTAKPITQVMVRNIAGEVLTYDQKHYKNNKNKTTTIK